MRTLKIYCIRPDKEFEYSYDKNGPNLTLIDVDSEEEAWSSIKPDSYGIIVEKYVRFLELCRTAFTFEYINTIKNYIGDNDVLLLDSFLGVDKTQNFKFLLKSMHILSEAYIINYKTAQDLLEHKPIELTHYTCSLKLLKY